MKKNVFALWLSSRFFSHFGKQIQFTVVAWRIYELTKDPLALGLIGLAQALPFLAISLWAGHFVDRQEKRRVMMGSEIGLLFCALGFLSTTLLPSPPIVLFYLFIGATGFCASFENISSSAYSQLLIPKEQFPRAAAWNLTFFQLAIITGPLVGGWLLTHLDARVAFMCGLGCFLISLLLASLLIPQRGGTAEINPEPAVKRVVFGLQFIRSQPLILSAMLLDMVAVLFGDTVALFPIFADNFQAGAIGFGLLRASPAIGSGLLSLGQALRPFIGVSWRNLKYTVLAFSLCMVAFALSPSIHWAIVFLVLSGMADGISVIIRQSTYQAYTPDHLRGRVASVSAIFITTSNEIGAFESGVMARLFGTITSVLINESLTLFSVLGIGRIFKGLEAKR